MGWVAGIEQNLTTSHSSGQVSRAKICQSVDRWRVSDTVQSSRSLCAGSVVDVPHPKILICPPEPRFCPIFERLKGDDGDKAGESHITVALSFFLLYIYIYIYILLFTMCWLIDAKAPSSICAAQHVNSVCKCFLYRRDFSYFKSCSNNSLNASSKERLSLLRLLALTFSYFLIKMTLRSARF